MVKNTVWEYNGHQFEFDLMEVDTLEHYEECFDRMSEREKAVPKDGKKSVQYRAMCALLYSFFDDFFGDGTSESLFGDKRNNMDFLTDAYDSFLGFSQAQMLYAAQKQADISTRYSPNRAQRRASK